MTIGREKGTVMIDIDVTIEIRARAQCSECGRSIETRHELDEVEAQRMSVNLLGHVVKDVREKVDQEMQCRGWREVCGRCRDKDVPGDGSRGPSQ
jgi:DNA-directed RNA polymerase subunit M/transcription elongation factor TFIIS